MIEEGSESERGESVGGGVAHEAQRRSGPHGGHIQIRDFFALLRDIRKASPVSGCHVALIATYRKQSKSVQLTRHSL
jgi:hypothetical protein